MCQCKAGRELLLLGFALRLLGNFWLQSWEVGKAASGRALRELPVISVRQQTPFPSCALSSKILLMQGSNKPVNVVRWAKGCLIPCRFQQFNVLNIVTADLNSEIVILTLYSFPC